MEQVQEVIKVTTQLFLRRIFKFNLSVANSHSARIDNRGRIVKLHAHILAV